MAELQHSDKNRRIKEKYIRKILRRYGIDIHVDTAVYKQAFVHHSFSACGSPELTAGKARKPIESNERLEFLGDGVLELVAKKYLYDRFPTEDEGFMTEKKIAIVKNEHIGKLALELGLHRWCLLSKEAESRNVRTNLKRLGCLFEAWIGAIFVDHNGGAGGYAAATTFIQNVLEEHVDWQKLITTDDNYKNLLQMRIQKVFKITPEYVELGRSKDKGYRMGVFLALGAPIHAFSIDAALPYSKFGSLTAIAEKEEDTQPLLVHLGDGEHKVKKKAEQKACLVALRRIVLSGGN